MKHFIEDYWDIFVGLIFVAIAIFFHNIHNIYLATLTSAIAIAILSITVSEIADIISERLQEPYGSLILTFTAVLVEIILLYIILREAVVNKEVVETVKGGIVSAVIVDLNVLLGLAVFIGGLRYVEQKHNEETSSTYTTVLFVSTIMLLVPGILSKTEHSEDIILKASFIISFLLFAFYIAIFFFQTKTHTHFFKATARSRILRLKKKKKEKETEEEDYIFDKFSNRVNFFFLFVFIAIIAVTAEIFAHSGVIVAKEYNISTGLAGIIIAIISVTPEIVTAIRAAVHDEVQRVVNIAMGASTVSILLTVPILMILAYVTNIRLSLDFNPLEIAALLMTIILVWKTTDEGETNYFEGLSHLFFFAAYAIIAAFY